MRPAQRSAPGALHETSDPAAGRAVDRVEGMRAYPHGELFLLTKSGDGVTALVYNTTGGGPSGRGVRGNRRRALAAEHGCDLVWKNPRRFRMMDALTIDLVGEPATFGGAPFNPVAKMHMPAGFDPGKNQSALACHPTQIHRVNVYEFSAGRPVHLLRDPDEVTSRRPSRTTSTTLSPGPTCHPWVSGRPLRGVAVPGGDDPA